MPGPPITAFARFLLAMVGGAPTAVDPFDAPKPVFGDLFVDNRLPDGTQVKSALQLLGEEARRRSIDDWCGQHLPG